MGDLAGWHGTKTAAVMRDHSVWMSGTALRRDSLTVVSSAVPVWQGQDRRDGTGKD